MWQCGQLKTAHNVYGLKLSRVEVKNYPVYGASPLTTGGRMYWDGEASDVPGRASRPCTTHEESFISRGDHKEEMSSLRVWETEM